jgi:hypothetical protein
MIPICLGFVWMRTQSSHTGIDEAIRTASTHIDGDGRMSNAIRDRTDERQDQIDGVEYHELVENVNSHQARRYNLGCLIEGDVLNPGPVHIYTRLWTHMAIVMEFRDGFWELLSELKRREMAPAQNGEEPIPLNINEPTLYPPNRPKYFWILLLATVFSFFVQWSATGSAIVIAYL